MKTRQDSSGLLTTCTVAGSCRHRVVPSAWFTGRPREAVVDPAFMPGLEVNNTTRFESRLRDFSLSGFSQSSHHSSNHGSKQPRERG